MRDPQPHGRWVAGHRFFRPSLHLPRHVCFDVGAIHFRRLSSAACCCLLPLATNDGTAATAGPAMFCSPLPLADSAPSRSGTRKTSFRLHVRTHCRCTRDWGAQVGGAPTKAPCRRLWPTPVCGETGRPLQFPATLPEAHWSAASQPWPSSGNNRNRQPRRTPPCLSLATRLF